MFSMIVTRRSLIGIGDASFNFVIQARWVMSRIPLSIGAAFAGVYANTTLSPIKPAIHSLRDAATTKPVGRRLMSFMYTGRDIWSRLAHTATITILIGAT